MSDFFAHLMDRSSGIADVLRPKRSSLFEPVIPEFSKGTNRFPLTQDLEARLDDDMVLETTQQSHGKRNEQGITRSSMPVELLPGHKREASVELLEGVKPSAEKSVAGAEQEQGPLDLRAKYPLLEAKRQVERGQESEVSSQTEEYPSFHGEARIHSLLPLQTEARPTPTVPAEGTADHLASPVSVSEVLSRVAAEQFSHLPAHDSATSKEDQEPVLGSETAIGSTAAPVKPLFLKPLVPEKRDSKHKITDTQTRDISPSIHVTIGRVEVRASVSEPPGRKEREASPVMSLEDYLKRQANGAGR